MARLRREINGFSISFLDLITGALGAVIILYVSVPRVAPEKKELEKLKLEHSELKKSMTSMKNQSITIQKLESELAKVREEKIELEKLASDIPKQEYGTGLNVDVGFKFKGKRIVFIIDTSRSMLEEDRMGQVKAGLKMLLISMGIDFAIDIVQFPNGERTPYQPLWQRLESMNLDTKQRVFEFIFKMRPLGGTPTRDVLKWTLQHYKGLSDVVLLTDGEPSLHNSSEKDDIYDILKEVREVNKEKVRINTIGVGAEVLKDKTSRPYKFLQLLAEMNDGFFVGF